MINCVRLVPGDAQLSYFDIIIFHEFLHIFFSHVPRIYIALCAHSSIAIRDGEN